VKWGPILPAEQVPSLVDECGLFFSGPHVFRERPPRMQEILAELQAQLDRVRRLGFPVAYVDSHMMIEWAVDGLEEQMCAWTAQEGCSITATMTVHSLRESRTLTRWRPSSADWKRFNQDSTCSMLTPPLIQVN
jgi:predicted glycoside hydrolase/deacetylase ChbG (UPF0249 family)